MEDDELDDDDAPMEEEEDVASRFLDVCAFGLTQKRSESGHGPVTAAVPGVLGFVDVYVLMRCRYVHRINPGSSLEAKSTQKSYHWVEYFRYFRLFPQRREGEARRVLVLRDVCSFDKAVCVLTELDPDRYLQALDDDRGIVEQRGLSGQLSSRVLAGTYEWHWDRRVEVHLRSKTDDYYAVLGLDHAGENCFGGRLQWHEFSIKDQKEEVTHINLGRSKYGDGSAQDNQKDHYPVMYFRSCPALEHLL